MLLKIKKIYKYFIISLGKSHKYPVYNMSIIGSGTSIELVTASSDGMVCVWDITRLTEPTSISFINPKKSNLNMSNRNIIQQSNGDNEFNSVNITSIAFTNENNMKDVLLVGSGAGLIYSSNMPLGVNVPITQVCSVVYPRTYLRKTHYNTMLMTR